jgi:hypothetical protein
MIPVIKFIQEKHLAFIGMKHVTPQSKAHLCESRSANGTTL